MASEESTAALRVFSFSRTVTEICEVVGHLANECHEIGARYSPRNPTSRKYDRTTCIYESGLPMGAGIEEHITAVLDFIETKKQQFELLRGDSEFDIMCSFSSQRDQGSISLNSVLLKRLAEFECDIGFDIYMDG